MLYPRAAVGSEGWDVRKDGGARRGRAGTRIRGWRLVLLGAVAVAVGAIAVAGVALPAAARDRGEFEVALRRAVLQDVASHRYPEDVLPPAALEALVAEAGHRFAAGASREDLRSWVADELLRAFYGFAPAGATHAPEVRYRVPFDPVVPRLVSQGPGEGRTHVGDEHHAVDFLMPEGTEVRAARAGRVGRVVDGFREGGLEERFKGRGNLVMVLHDDGTFASYLHLQPGIPVRQGQRVRQGEVLGRTGLTGYMQGPHLHFVVSRLHPNDAATESLPVRFGPPGSAGVEPRTGVWMGAPPRPNLEISLTVDGAATSPGVHLPVQPGQRARIRVRTRPRDGRPGRDVTLHPRTELVSMTPWSVTVLSREEVVFEPMGGFEHVVGTDLATVSAFYVNRAEGEIGLGKVEFRLVPEAGGAEPGSER